MSAAKSTSEGLISAITDPSAADQGFDCSSPSFKSRHLLQWGASKPPELLEAGDIDKQDASECGGNSRIGQVNAGMREALGRQLGLHWYRDMQEAWRARDWAECEEE